MSSHAPRRRAGRPPGETAERTRTEILEAALEAFAEAGFEAMSVRELTRRLGVSHNLVHHHFGTKQELWQAALDHGLGPLVREVVDLLGQGIGGPNPRETLREGMERGMQLLSRHPALARILADESARGGARLDHLFDRYLQPGLTVMKRFFESARGSGVREADPGVAALFVLSAASSLFTHGALARKLGLGDPTVPGLVSRYSAALIDLSLGGLIAADSSR